MIRRRTYSFLRLCDHLTLLQAIRKRLRHEHVIESHMRIPRRKRISFVIRMQHPKSIAITGIEHELNRLTLQLAPTDPDQCANPRRHLVQFQNFSRRKRVEVTNESVKPVLMSLDSIKQRSNLARASAFIPS